MKKKIIYAVFCVCAVIAFVSGFAVYEKQGEKLPNAKQNVAEDNKITEIENTEKTAETENVYNVSYSFDILENIADKDVLNEIFKNIAIIRIDSIDKTSNVDENGNETMVYTEGKATVLYNIKGEIDTEEIVYKRMGGKMPWSEWIKNVTDSEKLINMADGKNNNYIVDAKAEGDIDLECGKTYLVFMKKDEHGKYNIGAHQYGMRELQTQNTSTYSSNRIESIMVKDNVTGEWTPITEVVNFG